MHPQLTIANQTDRTRHRVQVAVLPDGTACDRWPLVDLHRHAEPAGEIIDTVVRGMRLRIGPDAPVAKAGHDWLRTSQGHWVANYWLAPEPVTSLASLAGARPVPGLLGAVAEHHGLQDHVHALWCICLTEGGGLTQDLNGGILRARYEADRRDEAWLASHDGDGLVGGKPPVAGLAERLYWTSLGTAQVLGSSHEGQGFPGPDGPVHWLEWMALEPEREFRALVRFLRMPSKALALHALVERDWHALSRGYGSAFPDEWLERFLKHWERIPDAPPVAVGLRPPNTISIPAPAPAPEKPRGPDPDAPLHAKALHHAGRAGAALARHTGTVALGSAPLVGALGWAVANVPALQQLLLSLGAPLLMLAAISCDASADPACSLDRDAFPDSPAGQVVAELMTDLHDAWDHGHGHPAALPDHDHALPDHGHDHAHAATPEPAATPAPAVVTVLAPYRVHECAGLVEDGCAVLHTVRTDIAAAVLQDTEGWLQVRLDDDAGTTGWVAREGVRE